MKFTKPLLTLIVAGCCACCAWPAHSDTPSAPAAALAERDGSHDFDFNFGLWKTQLKRRVHALSGSDETIELNGTVKVRKVWNGRAHSRKSTQTVQTATGRACRCSSTTRARTSGARHSSAASAVRSPVD